MKNLPLIFYTLTVLLLVSTEGLCADFKTALFDVTKGCEEMQGGVLSTMGAEIEDQSLNVLYMHTGVTEDKTILAEDTRGKAYYFPGYDVNDSKSLGNMKGNTNAAP